MLERTHWIAFYANKNHATYCDSFGVEYIPEVIKKFIGHIDVTANIFIGILIPTTIASPAIRLKMCAIIVGIKKYKSIIKKKRKNSDKIVFLEKNKLNCHRSLNF